MQRAKSKHEVQLVGKYYEGFELATAKTSDARLVVCFIGPSAKGLEDEYFHLQMTSIGDAYVLTTPKGKYELVKHPSQNYWHCEVNGVKMHFMPKKVVATLHYWA